MGLVYDQDTWELIIYSGDTVTTYKEVSPYHRDRVVRLLKRGKSPDAYLRPWMERGLVVRARLVANS